MFDEKIDIRENYILEIDKELLSILLKDHSSNRNIIWATGNYAFKGSNYDSHMPITVNLITGRNGRTIKPRVHKSKKEQLHRVRDKAEVFTPSWICNAQNNLVDNAWFGRENVFNIEGDKSWNSVKTPIQFPDEKTWQEYVTTARLEITCGEAPYLCSRYDTVSGEWIELSDRIGLLDRKLRIVGEQTTTEEEWLEWTIKAFQAIYGFEWQGDTLSGTSATNMAMSNITVTATEGSSVTALTIPATVTVGDTTVTITSVDFTHLASSVTSVTFAAAISYSNLPATVTTIVYPVTITGGMATATALISGTSATLSAITVSGVTKITIPATVKIIETDYTVTNVDLDGLDNTITVIMPSGMGYSNGNSVTILHTYTVTITGGTATATVKTGDTTSAALSAITVDSGVKAITIPATVKISETDYTVTSVDLAGVPDDTAVTMPNSVTYTNMPEKVTVTKLS